MLGALRSPGEWGFKTAPVAPGGVAWRNPRPVGASARCAVGMEKKRLNTCRGEGSVVGPLLAVLRCRCAALLVLVLMSTLVMPNCGAQGARRKALLLSDPPRTPPLLISYKEYGWIGQQSGSGFSDLAPSILHYNWF